MLQPRSLGTGGKSLGGHLLPCAQDWNLHVKAPRSGTRHQPCGRRPRMPMPFAPKPAGPALNKNRVEERRDWWPHNWRPAHPGEHTHVVGLRRKVRTHYWPGVCGAAMRAEALPAAGREQGRRQPMTLRITASGQDTTTKRLHHHRRWPSFRAHDSIGTQLPAGACVPSRAGAAAKGAPAQPLPHQGGSRKCGTTECFFFLVAVHRPSPGPLLKND